MHVLTIESGRTGYRDVVNFVVEHGEKRAPRGQWTRDTGPTTIVVRSPYDALPIGIGRKLNDRIAAAEAVQLIGAFSDPRLLTQASPNFMRYQEPNGSFHGAYGRRIGDQLSAVRRKLTEDPDTRQAVITLWDPWLDNQPDKRDYPCTVAFNFSIVHDRLELRTLMRSNDVWLGFAYDVFQFTQMQLTLARVLGIEPGPYTHTAWSLHIYEEHVELADKLTTGSDSEGLQIEGIGRPGDSIRTVRERAQSLPYRESTDGLTKSEKWYHGRLHPLIAS